MDTIETIQEEVRKLREDVDRLKSIVEDEGELSDEMIQEIEEARKTPRSEFVELK